VGVKTLGYAVNKSWWMEKEMMDSFCDLIDNSLFNSRAKGSIPWAFLLPTGSAGDLYKRQRSPL
jgi:hypothetical protein